MSIWIVHTKILEMSTKTNATLFRSTLKTWFTQQPYYLETLDSGLDVWSDKQVIEKEDCRLDWNYLNSLNESSPNMIKICHKK